MQSTSKLSHVIMILYGSLPHDTRVLREAKALTDRGYDVTVLDIDWGLGERECSIKRHSLMTIAPSKRASFLGLVRFWILVLKEMFRRRASIDIIHAHDLTGLPPASVFVIVNPRVKIVYDSHELFPEAALEKLSIIPYILFLGIELICGRCVDSLISVSPSILRTLRTRISAPTSLVLNTPDTSELSGMKELPSWSYSRSRTQIRIAYAGQVNTHRGYEAVIDAAELLAKQYDRNVEFWIIGGGPFLKNFQKLVRERGTSAAFVFTGRVGFPQLLSLTADCDIAIALYEATWNNNASIGNKLFEYMMIGMPIIYTKLTQSLPILNWLNAEIIPNPATGQKVATSIITLFESPDRMKHISERGKELTKKRFNWDKEARKLLNAYMNLASRCRS